MLIIQNYVVILIGYNNKIMQLSKTFALQKYVIICEIWEQINVLHT